MEAVLFVGMQASGKSTFYRERFYTTHLRINLDMLRTRHREKRFVDLCLETRLRFVVDNTNPTRADRQRYLEPARPAGFKVVGYYFQSCIEDCLRRNEQRPPAERIPVAGLLRVQRCLELPALEEGFDELHYVKIVDSGFVVEKWKDACQP
jgi:predicted kinase